MKLGQQRSRPWYRGFVLALGVASLVLVALGFWTASGPAAGQTPIHQWLGLIVAAGMVGHLLLHWDWLARMLSRSSARPSQPARTDWFMDCALAILVLAILVSGLAMGGAMGGDLARTQPWQGAHHLCSKLLIVVGGWHVIRHRRWLGAALRRISASRRSQPCP